jgi:phosphate-selective porin OprO/OprP
MRPDSQRPPATSAEHDIWEQIHKPAHTPASPAPKQPPATAPTGPGSAVSPQSDLNQSAAEKVPGVASQRGHTALEMSGRVQLLLRSHSLTPSVITGHENEKQSIFDIASARLQAEGAPLPKLEYKVSAEFAGSVRLKDAYLNYLHQRDRMEIRFGQFLFQFGAENSQSSRYYEFVEKAPISSALTQSRDRGISVRGELMDDKFYYFAGICNGEGTSPPEQNSSFDYLGRVSAQLLDPASSKWRFWLVSSATSGTRDNIDGDSVEIESGTGNEKVYFEAEFPEQKKFTVNRFSIDGKVLTGPWHATAEYEVGNYGIENTASISGGFVTVGYFFTGEQRTVRQGILKRQKVTNPVDAGGKGAWEVALRYSWFDVDPLFFTDDGLFAGWTAVDTSRFVNSGNAWSVGLNWYPNSSSRVMLNWIRNTVRNTDPAVAASNISAENALVMRLQLEF